MRKIMIPNARTVYRDHTGAVWLIIPINPRITKIKPPYRKDALRMLKKIEFSRH
jgi:hypothetical protein